MMATVLSAHEYARLKDFLLFFTTAVFKVETTPTGNVLVDEISAMEKKAPRRAQQALTMVVNDSIEMSGDWYPDRVASFDAELAAAGVMTLTEVRHAYSKEYLKIVKRGKIRNEQEYYLVKGVLDGLTSHLEPSEIDVLIRILSKYEDAV